MEQVEIVLNKEELMGRVDVLTAYAGAKGEDVALFDKVATTRGDRELLEAFLGEGLGLVGIAIAGFSPRIVNGEEEVTIAFTVPNVSDPRLVAMACQQMGDYLVKMMTARWMALASAPHAEGAAVEASALIESIIKALNFKSYPQRPQYR